jgi:hypothetical protein
MVYEFFEIKVNKSSILFEPRTEMLLAVNGDRPLGSLILSVLCFGNKNFLNVVFKGCY